MRSCILVKSTSGGEKATGTWSLPGLPVSGERPENRLDKRSETGAFKQLRVKDVAEAPIADAKFRNVDWREVDSPRQKGKFEIGIVEQLARGPGLNASSGRIIDK